MLVLYQAILAVKTSNGQGRAGQGGGEFRFRQSPVGLPSACSHTGTWKCKLHFRVVPYQLRDAREGCKLLGSSPFLKCEERGFQ